MVTEEIIERIKKLLAMRDGAGATSNEAEVAAAKVRQLLDAHGMTMAEVEAIRDQPTAVEWHGVEHGYSERPPPWVKSLVLAIACGFDLKVTSAPYGRLWFVGFEQDAAVGRYLFSVLRVELRIAAVREADRRGIRGVHRRRFVDSFLIAAAERIHHRMDAMRKSNSAAAALITCKEALIKEKLPEKSAKPHEPAIRSRDGAYLGDAFGSRVHLGTDGIESKAAAPLAIGHSQSRRG